MTALSVAIPTYGREQVLIDSIEALLALDPPPEKLLVIDQTPDHEPSTEAHLQDWDQQGRLRWIRLKQPSITAAMNRALLEAQGQRVLFLDDDIIPSPGLLHAHLEAHRHWPGALIAGRVLQPWYQGQPDAETAAPFRFNSLKPRPCSEFMGGNFSLPRQMALELGGFDENFTRVAYRFEAEFAHRWRQCELSISYIPEALIDHLHTSRGGTRSYGEHLRTLRPDHAVGRYYHLLCTRPFHSAVFRSAAALFRAPRTRHHLHRPWWIPLTLLAELRGLFWAFWLSVKGPRLLSTKVRRLLIVTTHPIQYQAPLFRALASDGSMRIEVLFLTLPDAQLQGVGFGLPFTWDVPLLDGYHWRVATSTRSRGDQAQYLRLWLAKPMAELAFGPERVMPDAVLITGWQCLGMLQMLIAARLRCLPILLRTEANDLRARSWPVRLPHRLIVAQAAALLPIGKANARFYRRNGASAERLWSAPYFVDNQFFAERAKSLAPFREELRQQWGISGEAFCFLFVGKFQAKKHPLDLLLSLERLREQGLSEGMHVLFVGSGELNGTCRQYAQDHELAVSFAGFLNQTGIAQAYVVADALVLPSDSGETWGLVVNEAMACGLPAIVSDQVGCVEDLVLHEHTGLTFPCGDIDSLAGAMHWLSEDRERADAMGKEARRRLMEIYNVSVNVHAIKDALARRLAAITG